MTEGSYCYSMERGKIAKESTRCFEYAAGLNKNTVVELRVSCSALGLNQSLQHLDELPRLKISKSEHIARKVVSGFGAIEPPEDLE